MATLQTYSFSAIVSNIATATQAAASSLLDYTVGSVLLAIAQATAGVTLWLQAIILQVLTLTRASTSQGSDLDSFMADYGVTRLVATAATGVVTFSRFTASQQATVPAGSTVQTADGTQSFAVTMDTTNAAWNAGLNAYVLAVNTSSVSVPVQASVAGSGGNVQSGTITVITAPIPGVDTVTNASAFTNGIDAESDPALRTRFVLYLASLSKATKTAVGYAVTSTQQGLDYTITEDYAYSGAYQPGFFYVVVDDGTGYPSSDLLTSVSNAIEAVRGLTIGYAVFAPIVLTANVTMILTTASGYTHANVVAAVGTALQNFINGLAVGISLPYTQLASIAYDVPGVTNVTGILLNSATTDLTANKQHKILCGTLTISSAMTGDQADFVARIKALLPNGWFRSPTPLLDGVLNGIAWTLALAYSLIQYAALQTRIATATDGFLDLISFDFFGSNLPRKSQELDAPFRARIQAELLLERGTRNGLIKALQLLTGRTPWVFEPRRPADTGGYGKSCMGYGVAGRYGSRLLPFQAFVIAYRPIGQGIPNVAGYGKPQGAYGTASRIEYASKSMIQGFVTDADMFATISGVKDAGTIIWTAIQS